MKARSILVNMVLLILAKNSIVYAQIFVDYTWNNPSGGSYHTASNWTPSSGFGGIPDSVNEGAVFNLAGQYLVALTTDISTNSALVRDGTVLLALGTAANPRSYSLNSLTVAPGTGGGDPHLAVFDGTLNAKTIQVAGGGQLDLDSDVLNFDNGSATVTGAGSIWNQTTGFLRVGENGTGTLLVEDGARVFNNDGMAIGRFAGSNGTATITGNNSLLDVDADFTIGQDGMGTLVVEDEGNVESALVRIAFSGTAVGSATVTGNGSTWTNIGELRVGESGDGTLLIEAGGMVSNTMGSIGLNTGSVGSATVTGTGSTWTNTAMLDIGSFGMGELTISDGATVTNTMGRIGREAGSNGTVTVTGTGSTWTNNSELRIGNMGVGELMISDGGQVSNTIGRIARQTDSFGEVTVTGEGSTWTNSGELLVGESDRGTLMISAGGQVSATNGSIRSGGFLEPSSSVKVAGDGSVWMLSEGLGVGGGLLVESDGSAQVAEEIFVGGGVTIQSGGSVTSASGQIVGGSASVSGVGSTWDISGGLSLAASTVPIIGGPAILSILSDGSVSVAGDIVLTNLNSFVFLDGGTLTASTVSFQGLGTFDFLSGTLHVEQFAGGLVNQGGTLAPGNSAGTTEILFDYEQQSDATLQIEIGGTGMGTTYDFVDVGGNAILDGQLELELIEGFFPDPAEEFVVFNSNSLSGAFANVANNARLTTTDGSGSFLVHYGVGSAFDPTQIVLSDFQFASADFDNDGDVDGWDFLIWQRGGSPTPLSVSDLALWQTQYGASLSVTSPTNAVPEPTAGVCLCISGLLLALSKKR